jgi:hypothetical protein
LLARGFALEEERLAVTFKHILRRELQDVQGEQHRLHRLPDLGLYLAALGVLE